MAASCRRMMVTPEQAAAMSERELMYSEAAEGNAVAAVKPHAYAFTDAELVAELKTRDKAEDYSHYSVRVPCLACMHCVIVRTLRRERVVGNEYICSYLKRKVEKFGGCDKGYVSKGPTVIVVNDKGELMARKDENGKITSFPQATTIEEHDLRISKR